MLITTKIFGEIEVDDSKVINLPQGIVGFPQLTDFMLIHESDSGEGIKWLQSVQEPAFAMPVIDPLIVCPDYNPSVEDELLKPLGEVNELNMLVLTTITVPKEIEKMSVNLKAPIIINGDTRKAAQLIVDDDSYLVKYPVYEILKAGKEKAGE